MVKTDEGTRVQSLVGELRSHMLQGIAKKKKGILYRSPVDTMSDSFIQAVQKDAFYFILCACSVTSVLSNSAMVWTVALQAQGSSPPIFKYCSIF